MLDNDLEPDTRQQVEQHVVTCADCRRALEDLTVLRSAAGELEQLEPSAETWYAIRRRVRPERRPGRTWAWVWTGAATAAAVVLVAVLFVGRPGTPGSIAPTPTVAAADASRGLGDEYEHYLRGIDDALDEIRAALEENPGNPRVRMALYQAHQSKASALDRVVSGGY